jgi:NTE family protein
MPMRSRPDVLVLGGGGVLGEAWMMGLLAGLEDATGFDLRECESFVGTSAGSIVAAHLVAGRSPRRPSTVGTDLELGHAQPVRGLAVAAIAAARRAGSLALAASSTFAPLALGVAAPGGALLRALLLRRLPRPPDTLTQLRAEVEQSAARFDGRLRVATVDRGSGRRVVFGSPGAPLATVAEAVQASCTVPWLFAPVRIGNREYVDGGVWSPTNLDAAPAGRGTHVLCLNPTASLASHHTLLTVVRNVARSAVSIESLALRRRGAAVNTIAPNAECAAAMGSNFMDQEPRSRVLAAGYRQGLLVAADGTRW